MTETIASAMNRLMTPCAEPQDYRAENGLLYCGNCNTPKETFFLDGKKLFGRDRYPAECECKRTAREKQEAEEKESKRQTIYRCKTCSTNRPMGS